MEAIMDKIAEINGVVNNFIWGIPGLVLVLGAGILLTVFTKVFQLTQLKQWWQATVGTMLHKKEKADKKAGDKSISIFKAVCTALAATVGTGNIAGVATAIVVGGPGAVFWMWIAAFLGMMTKFSEIVLGMYFRRRNANGEWSGGPMYILKDGLGKVKGFKGIASVLAVLFSVFTILASFGIGNMSQVNNIVANVESAFFSGMAWNIGGVNMISLFICIALLIVTALIVLGGMKRIASAAEILVPFMAAGYILLGIIVVACNYDMIIPAFASIFKFAFGVKAVAGATAGLVLKNAIVQGCKRGVFSNEAGLGSAVLAHATSEAKEPVKQGMWGIFEVFFDTIVICSMTALIVLTSGAIDFNTGLAADGIDSALLVSQAFGGVFGKPGEWFAAIAMFFFAFTTILGWSHYGAKAVEHLFGSKAVIAYRIIFVLLILTGALMSFSLALDLSDTFNGLMMIPNLIGVLAMLPLVVKLTKNYINRKIKNIDEAPMLSYDKDIEAEYIAQMAEEAAAK